MRSSSQRKAQKILELHMIVCKNQEMAEGESQRSLSVILSFGGQYFFSLFTLLRVKGLNCVAPSNQRLRTERSTIPGFPLAFGCWP